MDANDYGSEHETLYKKSIGIWGNHNLKICCHLTSEFLPTKDGTTTGWWRKICLFSTPIFNDYLSKNCTYIVLGMGWNMLEASISMGRDGLTGVLKLADKHGNGQSPHWYPFSSMTFPAVNLRLSSRRDFPLPCLIAKRYWFYIVLLCTLDVQLSTTQVKRGHMRFCQRRQSLEIRYMAEGFLAHPS